MVERHALGLRARLDVSVRSCKTVESERERVKERYRHVFSMYHRAIAQRIKTILPIDIPARALRMLTAGCCTHGTLQLLRRRRKERREERRERVKTRKEKGKNRGATSHLPSETLETLLHITRHCSRPEP